MTEIISIDNNTLRRTSTANDLALERFPREPLPWLTSTPLVRDAWMTRDQQGCQSSMLMNMPVNSQSPMVGRALPSAPPTCENPQTRTSFLTFGGTPRATMAGFVVLGLLLLGLVTAATASQVNFPTLCQKDLQS